MNRAYKFRIYPINNQEIKLSKIGFVKMKQHREIPKEYSTIIE